jgi:hypothetical protein
MYALIFDDRPSDLALLKSWTAPSRSPISCWEFEERGLGSREESAVEIKFARASSLASSRSAMAIAVVIYNNRAYSVIRSPLTESHLSHANARPGPPLPRQAEPSEWHGNGDAVLRPCFSPSPAPAVSPQVLSVLLWSFLFFPVVLPFLLWSCLLPHGWSTLLPPVSCWIGM